MTNNSNQQTFTLAKITAVTLLAMTLAACGGGGGGGGMRPPADSGPGVGIPGGGGGGGGGGSSVDPRWAPVSVSDPNYNTQLDGTGAKAAHAAGVTGKGVTVGVVDSGIYTDNKALDDKAIPLYRLKTDGSQELISPDAPLSSQDGHVDGHGTSMAQIIAGRATAQFQGGVAPDANLIGVNVREDDGTIWGNTVHDGIGFLSSQGASIVNVSLGGSSGVVPALRGAGLDNAISNGTLVVFATGNEGNSQPSSNSLYPVNFADAKKGLLAVTALTSDGNGDYTQRWAGANACGSAAEWCLSAPAPARFLSTDTTEASSGATISGSIGTSNAAAMVSGVAALSKSAFPWMTNDNLRQTLLSTATYIADGSEVGGEKYNASFGWGRVNAEKAIRGPSGFYFGDFGANVSDGSFVFGNNIDGAGSLTKTGPGTLTLAGNNTYAGNTAVQAGLLNVIGANANSHFSVAPGGQLTGNGSVRQLTNDGVVVASNAGSLTVNGDYKQNASGTFIASKGSPLVVNGTADLAGKVDYRNYGYVNGADSDKIIAASTLTLNGLTVQAPVFLSVTHNTVGNDLYANVDRISATVASGLVDTSGELSSAKQLDAAFNAADTIDAKIKAGQGISNDEQTFLSAMSAVQNIGDVSIAKEAASRLSANSYALMPALVMETQRLDSVAVSDRMSKLNFDSSISDGPWATLHHARNRFDPDGYATAKTELSGIQIGYDKKMGDWLVGGYASFSDADTDFGDNGGTLKSEKYGFGAYAKRNFGSAYAQIQGGYQLGNSDFKKLSLDGLAISAKPDTGSFHIGAEAGYGIDVGAARITPFAGLAYDSVRLDSVKETGSTLGMSIDKKTLAESSANVGLKASWALNDWSRLGLYYKFDRVLNRKNQDMTARFLTGGAFSIDAPDYSKSRHTIGLTAQAVVGDNTTIAASYDNRFSSDSKTNTFFIGLKHAF